MLCSKNTLTRFHIIPLIRTDYKDRQQGKVHRDLRRAFTAAAMKYRIPTQLIRQQTVDGREKDHPSKVAVMQDARYTVLLQ